MPAKKAGLIPGDKILSINSNGVETWEDMTKIIHSSPNRLLSFKIKRGLELIDLDIKTSEYAIPSEGIIDTIGVIGIRPEVYYEDISFINALSNGMKQTISSFGLIYIA